MLASVEATDGGGDRTSRVGHCQSVRIAVSNCDTVRCCCSSTTRSCQNHRVEVYPQLADVGAGGTECVGAGVLVCAGGVGGDDGIGVVGAAATPAGDREDTANSEG